MGKLEKKQKPEEKFFNDLTTSMHGLLTNFGLLKQQFKDLSESFSQMVSFMNTMKNNLDNIHQRVSSLEAEKYSHTEQSESFKIQVGGNNEK